MKLNGKRVRISRTAKRVKAGGTARATARTDEDRIARPAFALFPVLAPDALGVTASERRRREAFSGDVQAMRRILALFAAGEREEQTRRWASQIRAMAEQHGRPYAERVLGEALGHPQGREPTARRTIVQKGGPS